MKLLLVEDEKSLSKVMEMFLVKASYIVETAYDGEEALNKIKNDEYDGIVMDIMMPKIDGLTVLKLIRSEGNLTPVVLVTAKTDIEDKIAGLSSGADDYITKPFEMKELVARISAITSNQKRRATSMTVYRNIKLDKTNLEIKSQTGSFRLSPNEYKTIEFLIKNNGNNVPLSRLLEKVWYSEGDENIVILHMNYLQRKLKALHATFEIIGNRESGFRLQESVA